MLLRLFPSCGELGLLCSCGARASHCRGFSCWGAWALEGHRLSSCGSRALALRLRSCGSRALARRLSSCLPGSSAQAQQLWLPGSRAQAQQLWCTDLVAPWHVGSSGIRNQTCVSCTETPEKPTAIFFVMLKSVWFLSLVSGTESLRPLEFLE